MGQMNKKPLGIWAKAQSTFETRGVEHDKTSQFKWATVDSPGECVMLGKHVLSVDHELYQRSVDNPSKVNKIAAEWSWMAFGVLIVAIRQDGSYWVIDGQNRLVAAMKRSDIDELPCMLFIVSNPEEEAAAFVRINRNRRALTRVDTFRAQVAAKDQQAIALRDLLEEFGYYVGQPGAKHSVVCIDRCMSVIRSDATLLRSILGIHANQFAYARVLNEVVGGLAYLAANGVDLKDPRVLRRLASVGHEQIVRSIRKAGEFRNRQSKDAWAEGIALALNHGLRLNVVDFRPAS